MRILILLLVVAIEVSSFSAEGDVTLKPGSSILWETSKGVVNIRCESSPPANVACVCALWQDGRYRAVHLPTQLILARWSERKECENFVAGAFECKK